MADIEANIGIGIDTSNALAAIKQLQRQISAFQRELQASSAANAASAQNFQRSLISDINATGKFSARLQTIRSATESFTNALERNKLSMGEYFRFATASTKSFGQAFATEFNTIEKVAESRVKTLQTQYISLGRDANGALKSIAVRPLSLDMNDLATRTAFAAQKQQIFNQLLRQGSTNLLNFGKNTQWAGRQLMVGFTVPLSILATTASKTFMQMEEQALRFKRVYGELFTTEAETNAMAEQIQSLALEFTKYGVAVEDTMSLAADAAAMGKMGADLTAQVAEATRLAVLGGVEQAQALETTTSLTNAFAIATEDLANKIDFLNAVENQTVTSIEDLTIAIPKAGPVVKQLGGDVEDLAFFLTAMKEGGINASEGANALKSGLASLINPTEKASDMLMGFGINIKGIVEANKGNVSGLVIDFARALDTLDPTTRARAIEQLFGKFQFARLSTLFQNVVSEGTQAQRVLELANATTQELAQLSSRELGRLEESTSYKFQKVVAELQAALAPIGEDFLKVIIPLVEFANNVLEAFNSMDAGVRQFVVGSIAVLAGLGPILIMTFGLLANGVANALKGFAFLRERFLGLGGQTTVLGEQIQYMTQEQLEASAVAASLDQVHSALTQRFTTEAAAVDALTAAYKRNIASLAGLRVSAIPSTLGGSPRKMKDGGIVMVPGSGKGDKVPAMLEPGEAVIPGDMVKKYGGLINGMIADNIPGYQRGKQSDKKSLYGGSTTILSGGGVPFAPGNTAGSKLGMTQAFFESEDFTKMFSAGAIGAAFRANAKSGEQMNLAGLNAYFEETEQDLKDIVDILRKSEESLRKAGKNIDSFDDITANAKKELEQKFDAMTAKSDRAAKVAQTVQREMLDPTRESMLASKLSETRARAIKANPVTGAMTETVFRMTGTKGRDAATKAAQLMFPQDVARLSAQGASSFAHLNEKRLGGPSLPMRGGMLTADPALLAAATAKLTEASAKQAAKYPQGVLTSRNAANVDLVSPAATKASADKAAKIYTEEFKKKTEDAYVATRDRNSPHPLAAKDGADDAKAYDSSFKKTSRRAASGGTVTVGSESGKFVKDPKSGNVFSAEKFAKQEESRAKAVGRSTQMVVDSMSKFSSKVQGVTFGISAVAGILTMFGGTVGEVGNVLFQVSGTLFGLITATQLLITAKMKEAATSAIAGMGGFGGLLKGPGGKIANLFGNLGTILTAVLPNLARFIPVIGIAVTALSAFAFVANIAEQQRKKIEGLGNAAFISGEKLKAAGEMFGFTAKASSLPQAFQGKASASPEIAAQAAELGASEEFANQWQTEIDAVKAATPAQAQAILYSLAQQLAASGAPTEAVQAIIKAITDAAGQKELDLSFSKINFAGTTVKTAASQAAELFNAEFAASQQNVGRGRQMGNTQTNKENAAIVGSAFASDLTAINAKLLEGTITVDDFNTQMSELGTLWSSLGEAGQKLVLPNLAEKIGATEAIEGIKDTEDAFMLLQAAATGLDPTEVANLAKAIKEGQDSSDPTKVNAYKKAQEKLNTVIKTGAKATADLVARQKEKNKQDELAAEFTGATGAIQADIDALNQQTDAYNDLIDKGWSTVDALMAVRDANFMVAYSTAVNATAQQEVIDKYKELINLTKTSPVTSGGGGGKKSPFQEGVEGLQNQRKQLIDMSVAYRKLTKDGMSATQAFEAVQDPATAAALAATKVGTKGWEKLVSLLKQTNILAEKKAIKELLRGTKDETAILRKQNVVTKGLDNLGYTYEQIQEIIADPTALNLIYKDLMKDGKINAKETLEYLQEIKKQDGLTVELNLKTKEGAAQEFQKLFDKAVEYLNEQRVKVELDFEVATAADQDIIEKAEDQIAGIQYVIDDYEAELVGIENQEEKINKQYDARQKALESVAKVNDKIARQQKGQLNVADALAQGDIAAAARAAQELEAQNRQDAIDSQREALDRARQTDLRGVRSASGKSREQIEAEVKKLKQQIFEIEEKSLEPARERVRLQEITKREAVQAIEAQIREWDILQNKVNLAKLKLTPEEMQAMKDQAKVIADMLQNWEDIKDKTAILTVIKKTVEEGSGGSGGSGGGNGGNGGIPDTTSGDSVTRPRTSDQQIMDAKAALNNKNTAVAASTILAKAAGVLDSNGRLTTTADTAEKKINSTVAKAATTIANNLKAGSLTGTSSSSAGETNRFANLAGSIKATKPGTVNTTTLAGILKASGVNKLAGGGMVKYMANGGLFSSLGTDIVPAMLTPGEFVVSRPAVKNFGADRLKAINSGASVGDSMYNYKINVNVQSNANPDQIARAVMTQIKQVDSQRIRGNRF
jgi:TP901 family phage tail tape measure protein